MKAVCWYGSGDVRVETVPEPKILNPRDAIVKVTLAAICGSDIHLYDGCIPSMRKGDILGHEFMGEVVEIGSEVKHLRPGDRREGRGRNPCRPEAPLRHHESPTLGAGRDDGDGLGVGGIVAGE